MQQATINFTAQQVRARVSLADKVRGLYRSVNRWLDARSAFYSRIAEFEVPAVHGSGGSVRGAESTGEHHCHGRERMDCVPVEQERERRPGMNEELKENLGKVINAELKKGTLLHVEVGKVLGDDLIGFRTEVKGSLASLTKMLLIAMSTNKNLKHIIQLAGYASFHIDVDCVKMPPIPDEKKGGEA